MCEDNIVDFENYNDTGFFYLVLGVFHYFSHLGLKDRLCFVGYKFRKKGLLLSI